MIKAKASSSKRVFFILHALGKHLFVCHLQDNLLMIVQASACEKGGLNAMTASREAPSHSAFGRSCGDRGDNWHRLSHPPSMSLLEPGPEAPDHLSSGLHLPLPARPGERPFRSRAHTVAGARPIESLRRRSQQIADKRPGPGPGFRRSRRFSA
jgi:hypothetical protein